MRAIFTRQNQELLAAIEWQRQWPRVRLMNWRRKIICRWQKTKRERQPKAMKLTEVLRFFEAMPQRFRESTTAKLTEAELYYLFGVCRSEYRRRVATMHPDRKGSNHQCAWLNTMWERAEELFGRMGIKEI